MEDEDSRGLQSGRSFQGRCPPRVNPTELLNQTIQVKQEPSESLAQHWETQWQDFLKNMETPHSQRRKTVSGRRTSQKSGAKMHSASLVAMAEDEQETPSSPDASGQEACERPDTIIVVDETKVKEESLDEDPETMEAQRQRFRQLCYCEGDGPRVVCAQLWFLCHQWLKPERHTKGQILELLVLEQLMTILPPEIQSWVREHGAETCAEAVALAEDFLLGQERNAKLNEQFREFDANESLNFPKEELTPSDLDVSSETKQEDTSTDELVGNDASLVPGSPSELYKNEEENCTRRFFEPAERFDTLLEITETGMTQFRVQSRPFENELTSETQTGSHHQNETDFQTVKVPAAQQSIPASERQKICKICGKRFSWRTDLIKHKRTHTGEKPYKCPDCGKGFSQVSDLNIHKRIHTGEKPFKCSHCSKRFTRSTNLIVHERMHTGEKPYKCSFCEKAFCAGSQLISHQRIHTGDKPYKCFECGRTFGWSATFRRHQRTHTGEKPYKCLECGKSFSFKSVLISHERIHTGDKPHTCSDCGKSFGQRAHLNSHQRIHTGERPFQCSQCGKSFSLRSVLITHENTHVLDKPHKCSDCGKSFSNKSQLTSHQRMHTGDKPYKCLVCGKTFNLSSLLTGHLRTHTGEKPYKCSYCEKSFGGRSTMVAHERTHTGEKPHRCSICGKTFSQKTNLNSHQRTHTGEKPHKCQVCGKCFSQKSHLLNHQRDHTGEKPFQCACCGKCFATKSNQVAHERIHSGEKPHKCKFCGRNFSRKAHLTRHERTHVAEKVVVLSQMTSF